jgi:DNA-binding transcriptional ArsR family regulator
MPRESKPPHRESGRFAYEGLERAIHEKARLGILTSLMTRRDGLLFTELKELCSLTDGNLNRHLKVLQDAGLVDVWKGSQKGKPQTLCRLTPCWNKSSPTRRPRRERRRPSPARGMFSAVGRPLERA